MSHFVRGHSANCTFCTISYNPEEHRETPLHLFYSCRSTEPVLNQVFSHFLRVNTIITRQELFVKFMRPEKPFNEILFLVSKLFLKYIWDCKVRLTIPNVNCCLQQICMEINCMKKISNYVNELVDQSRINFNTQL